MSTHQSHFMESPSPYFVSTIKTPIPLTSLLKPGPFSETPSQWAQVKSITRKARNIVDMRREEATEEAFPKWVASRCCFFVGLGIGYKVLGVSHGWLSTFTWLTISTCTLQHCSWCRALVTSPWWLSLCMEYYPMLSILVVLIEYLMFPLEVSYHLFDLSPFCWFLVLLRPVFPIIFICLRVSIKF